MGQMFTAKEAAYLLALSPQTLANWRVMGKGPEWKRIGTRRIAYEAKAIEKWNKENNQKRN